MEQEQSILELPPPTKPVVLRLRDVSLRSKSDRTLLLSSMSMTVRVGEVVVLQMDQAQRSREIASMIQGLLFPSAGEVLFQDSDWKGNHFDRHFQMRSKIGRVFDGQAWIANLNMLENVTLASDHHGKNHAATISEIQQLADRFSIDAESRERPAFVAASRLQRYQWVRAFIGIPSLILLERPMRSVAPASLPLLITTVDEACRSGAAVIWFTSNSSETSELATRPISRFRLIGGSLQPDSDVRLTPETTSDQGDAT